LKAALLSHTPPPNRATHVIYSFFRVVKTESLVNGDNKISKRAIALLLVRVIPTAWKFFPCLRIDRTETMDQEPPRMVRFWTGFDLGKVRDCRSNECANPLQQYQSLVYAVGLVSFHTCPMEFEAGVFKETSFCRTEL